MKNLILILVLSLSTVGASFANNNPESSKVVFETENITVSTNTELISLASFDANESRFDFETKKEVSFIQIYDVEGNLQFQLPVQSDKVRISKDLFDQGVSKVAFLFDDSTEVNTAEINIK